MAKISFVSLECVRKNDVIGKDEPEILIDGVVRWSSVMEKKQVVSLKPLFHDFNGRPSIVLSLRERDSPTSHMTIGTRTVTAGHPDPQPVDFKTSGTHYRLWYAMS